MTADTSTNKSTKENVARAASLAEGVKVIKAYLKNLPETPGVYRMINRRDEVVYVGKAKALKKRVASYTQPDGLPVRIRRMIAQTVRMEFITTGTEIAALLLECNLIKELRPTYNVLLKDDKSFPFIQLTSDHTYPALNKYRGNRKEPGRYFGPYPSPAAVNQTLTTLQKAFMLRNCTDSQFENRSRPCLQYHIKRCTAPCVGYVSENEYSSQIEDAISFLSGKSSDVQSKFADHMQKASDDLDFEKAAFFRDRLKALSYVQMRHDAPIHELPDCDLFAIAHAGDTACIQAFFFRGGRSLGNAPSFIKLENDESLANALSSFLPQFYKNKPMSKTIFINQKLDEQDLLAEALSSIGQKSGIELITPQRGAKKKVMEWAEQNAKSALERKLSDDSSQKELLEGVQNLFDLAHIPQRIEVYDNSHISGTNMIGAMIVAGPEGFVKKAYRKFNIRGAKEADDFGMMREVLSRRLSNLQDIIKEYEQSNEESDLERPSNIPDLLLIDGGAGQLSSVMEVIDELNLRDYISVVAIAKGPDRNAGREEFYMPDRKPFQLPKNDPVLHYLQRLRDESHRFAITSHRKRRQGDIKRSPLDDLPGVGPKRKKALLHHYGSGKAVMQASKSDLETVEGISKALAQQIYSYFHPEG